MKNKISTFAIILIFASAFLVAIPTTPTSASPAVINVPGDYSTIQYAVGNASSGDTINVTGGPYNEDVTITKGLTLTTPSGAKIVGGIWIKDIHTFTDPITVENFIIENGTSLDATHDYGVKISGDIGAGSDQAIVDMHIVNNTFINCGKTDDVAAEVWWNAAVFFDANHFGALGNRYDTIFAGTGEISNNTITNNLGDPAKRTQLGVGVRSGRNMKINYNNISGNVAEGIHHWGPVNTTNIGNYEINHNYIDLTGWIGDRVGNNPRGIWSYAPQSSVSHNTIVSKWIGMVLTYWDDTNWGGGTAGPNYNLTVSHNVIHPPAGENMSVGLRISGSNSKITDNEIHGAINNVTGYGVGLLFEGWGVPAAGERTECENNTFTGNYIHDNNDGVWTWGPPWDNTLGNEFHHNDIENNINSGMTNNARARVIATNNWWGHSSGPYQNDTNPMGLGNKVSNNVTYSPWLGFVVGTTPMTYHVNPTGKIQDAIDDANPGDTILVHDGTYNEALYIDRSLTVKAASTPVVNGSQSVTTNYGLRDAVIFVEDSTNVILEGLDIEGFGLGTINAKNYGVIYENSSGTIRNCTVSPNTVGDMNSAAIGAWDGSDLTIDLSTIKNYGRIGVFYYNNCTGGVYNSTIIGQVYGGEGEVCYGIEVEGVPYGGPNTACQITITGNEIYNHDNTYSPAPSWSSAGIVINGWLGYYPQPDSTVIIEKNDIHDNYYGIEVVASSLSSAHCNNIYNSRVYGVIQDPDYANNNVTFEACCNWWGDASGPYHNVTNTTGLGDRVSDNVHYDPWSNVQYPIPVDINNDCIVNIVDIVIAAMAFGSSPGDPNWNPAADLNGDNSVNIIDLVMIGINFGKGCA